MDQRPYKQTLRGRSERGFVALLAFLRRTGAGSIAIAIGALGAGVLLATTLIFPPAPSQEVFSTPAVDDVLASPFERGRDDRIEVETRESVLADRDDREGTGEAAADDGSGLTVAAEVLGTLTSKAAPGSTQVGQTTTDGVKLDTDGAQAGGKGGGKGGGKDGDGSTGVPPVGPGTPTTPTNPNKGDEDKVDQDDNSDGGDDDEDNDSDSDSSDDSDDKKAAKDQAKAAKDQEKAAEDQEKAAEKAAKEKEKQEKKSAKDHGDDSDDSDSSDDSDD